MPLTGGHFDGQGQAAAVSNQMEFTAESAYGAKTHRAITSAIMRI
jgi:hypothetical protein